MDALTEFHRFMRIKVSLTQTEETKHAGQATEVWRLVYAPTMRHAAGRMVAGTQRVRAGSDNPDVPSYEAMN